MSNKVQLHRLPPRRHVDGWRVCGCDRSETRFRAIADAAPIGVFEADADGHVCYTNAAWEAITGIEGVDALDAGWQRMLHADDKDRVLAKWSAGLLKPVAYTQRFRIVRRDGTERHVDARVAPIVVEDKPDGFVGTLVDATHALEAEVLSDRARRQALESSRLKSGFIANISHEIRTPLNGVIGLTQILSDTSLDAKQRVYVDTLRQAGEDLLGLLNDVLDLSKVEAGAMRVESVAFDARRLIGESARLFEPTAAIRRLTLDVVVAPTVPKTLSGDPTRLRQVLSNLLSNAIKFTDCGGVTLSAEAIQTGADQVNLRLVVHDTGPGIPDDARQRIFEPFAQVDSSTTRRFGGSGLGLSISKQIVELMGGTLSVESVVGQGSTFTVDVPLRLGTVEPTVQTRNGRCGSRRTLRILIAEDNPINQLVLQTMLTNLGHDVATSDDGAVAAELAQSGSFDLVFMDCQMPVMDGYAATAAIRALPGKAGRVPIVALTASAMTSDRERCLDAGMDEYLAKPVIEADLVAVLDRIEALAAVASPAIASTDLSSYSNPLTGEPCEI